MNAIADTGWCGSQAMPQVARLLDSLSGDVLLVGDLAYMNGLLDEFRRCFDPDFGRLGARARPAPGNHDYGRPDADGYFTYFGDRAGPGRRGYYAFRAGSWQVLMLNSSVPINRHSEQYAWVQQRLQQEPARCTLAAVHHPLDSSGTSGANPWLRDMWGLLHDNGAEIVVSGHDHLYERFAPQDATQRPDPARGVRLFIAGTGGAPLYPRSRSAINSEIVIQSHGALRLKLDPDSFEWMFLDVHGNALDRGMGTCH
ncbi:MAG: metallophosphoesterase [Vicinamibacterales bacterium]